MRIRTQLLLIAAIVFVPGFLASFVAVQQVREGEREAELRGLRETVRASALLVDREVQRSVGVLTALAQSEHLGTGNFKAFYEQASATNLPHVWTILLDDTGSQVVNTAVPFGTPAPPPVAAQRVAQVLATNRLLVTNLIKGPATGKLLTTLYMPTKAWNGKRYVVAQAFDADHWKSSALQVNSGSTAIVGVIDRNGLFISRNRNADQWLGKPARPELVAAAASANEGLIRHATLEGIDSYDAFTHSELTGWTVAVAVPVQTVEASATRAVLWLAVSGLLALTTALAAAAFLGRSILGVIHAASEAATSVGQGVEPHISPSSLKEVNMLYASLIDAGRVLAEEKLFRAAAEKERQALLERETALREAAQQQNATKDHFLALLGHELRNPLAAIVGATAVLAHPNSDAQAKTKFLSIIQRQNRNLTQIVDDLLDLSRLAAGKIMIDPQPVNLAACIQACVDAMRASDRAARHHIEVDASDAWINGDPVRLEQILSNLLSNAVKYSTPGSSISVSSRVVGDKAVMEVRDNGMGIGPDLMPHIFEPFVQGAPPSGQLSSGLGIGLALVKQLVELQSGLIEAESLGAGQGAIFRVTWFCATPVQV